MKNKITNVILLLIVVGAFIIGAVVYPQLPERIASHWGADGQANGYMGKFWGIFLLPLIMLGMLVLYFVILLIDPLKNNIQSFRKYYNYLWIVLEVFMLYVFALTIAWNFGYRFNFTTAIVPATAVLFFFMGSFLKNIKRNWFVGIRTPWTLSSDEVWDKTHKLGGKLFQASAVISLLGLFFNGLVTILVIIIPVLISSLVAIVYSYIVYKKL
jgi:uncharacterized membrane protein